MVALLWDYPQSASCTLFTQPEIADIIWRYIETKTNFCTHKNLDHLREYIDLYLSNPQRFPDTDQNPYIAIVRQAAKAVDNGWRSITPRP
jgi:hypothetical protein